MNFEGRRKLSNAVKAIIRLLCKIHDMEKKKQASGAQKIEISRTIFGGGGEKKAEVLTLTSSNTEQAADQNMIST